MVAKNTNQTLIDCAVWKSSKNIARRRDQTNYISKCCRDSKRKKTRSRKRFKRGSCGPRSVTPTINMYLKKNYSLAYSLVITTEILQIAKRHSGRKTQRKRGHQVQYHELQKKLPLIKTSLLWYFILLTLYTSGHGSWAVREFFKNSKIEFFKLTHSYYLFSEARSVCWKFKSGSWL